MRPRRIAAENVVYNVTPSTTSKASMRPRRIAAENNTYFPDVEVLAELQ